MSRHIEIDKIKGVAVILMVIFHIYYLRNNMGFPTPNASGFFLKTVAQLSHYTFIIMAGINLFLSYKKDKNDTKKFYEKQKQRAIKLALYALIVTLVSLYTFGKKKYVRFGILHFMCVASILSTFIIDKKILVFLFVPLLFCIKTLINNNMSILSPLCSKSPFLCYILGIFGTFNYKYLGALDTFDLLSKLPIFLIGICLGYILYNKENNTVNNKENNITNNTTNNIYKKDLLALIGKKSLFIYMIHWVVIYFLIYKKGGRPIL
tara:strand:- start:2523 stop:3314 length:792 start_codon:yes stop_codon:yes gene_type:complete